MVERRVVRLKVGCRVSACVGELLPFSAQDDGADYHPGSAANARRLRRKRQRVYGTITATLGNNAYEVKWDAPNYSVNDAGVLLSQEVGNKLKAEAAGAGTGPASPRAQRMARNDVDG